MNVIRAGTRYDIAFILASNLIKQSPCELAQKQILEELEKTFDRKISRNTLANNLAALRKEGFVDSNVKGNPRVTVYRMTDKLLSFFEKEYQKFTALEQLILENTQETDADIQIKGKYQPLQKPAAPGFYCTAEPYEKLGIVEVCIEPDSDNELYILLPDDDHKYPLDLFAGALWFGPLNDADLINFT